MQWLADLITRPSMDAEEGGALEAARAPLVYDSDPQSPGSPFYPLLFRVLATTSSSYLRFIGDCVLVWAAYAVPCVLAEYPGSWFCYRSLMRGHVWAAGCVAWFYVLVAWNVKLFSSARPQTQRMRRPPMTRAVSSIRSPRRGGEPELTFFPSAASMPATP